MDLVPDECILLLKRELETQSVLVPELQLQKPMDLTLINLRHAIHKLQQVPGFQNAGDMLHVARRALAKSLKLGMALTNDTSEQKFMISVKLLISCVHELAEHRRRQYLVMLQTRTAHPTRQRPKGPPDSGQKQTQYAESAAKTEERSAKTVGREQQVETTVKAQQPTGRKEFGTSQDLGQQHVEREEGVSEEVWIQLQADKKEALKRSVKAEAKKKQEQIQRKLKDLRVCVAGFDWIEQEGGYRCAGGMHFMSHSEIGDL